MENKTVINTEVQFPKKIIYKQIIGKNKENNQTFLNSSKKYDIFSKNSGLEIIQKKLWYSEKFKSYSIKHIKWRPRSQNVAEFIPTRSSSKT